MAGRVFMMEHPVRQSVNWSRAGLIWTDDRGVDGDEGSFPAIQMFMQVDNSTR
jgi:hypothetical protein